MRHQKTMSLISVFTRCFDMRMQTVQSNCWISTLCTVSCVERFDQEGCVSNAVCVGMELCLWTGYVSVSLCVCLCVCVCVCVCVHVCACVCVSE